MAVQRPWGNIFRGAREALRQEVAHISIGTRTQQWTFIDCETPLFSSLQDSGDVLFPIFPELLDFLDLDEVHLMLQEDDVAAVTGFPCVPLPTDPFSAPRPGPGAESIKASSRRGFPDVGSLAEASAE